VLLWMPKRIGNWLAVHTRVHIQGVFGSVRGHEGRVLVPLTIWPVRDLESGFAGGPPGGGWAEVWDPHMSHIWELGGGIGGGSACQRQSDRLGASSRTT
jgi:hypothetical protein